MMAREDMRADQERQRMIEQALTNAQTMHTSLETAIDALYRESGTPTREDAVAIFRRHLGRHYGEIRQLFEGRHIKGIASASMMAALMDGVIDCLDDFARKHTSASTQPLCICATGGYGSGLLAPHSDIDLLFLTSSALTPPLAERIEFILYFLWDLGIRVGHATRSVAGCLEAVKTDITIRANLMDARPVAGALTIFTELQNCLLSEKGDARAFILSALNERERRHKQFGDNPFIVEPNIKEGRGGLRDLQTLGWMARIASESDGSVFTVPHPHTEPAFSALDILTEQERQRARRAWNFLWTIRLHLHYIAGRADERLLFETQPVIGARMGYASHGRQQGVERFMRHYFLTVREITRLGCLIEPVIMARLDPPQPSLTENNPAYAALNELHLTLVDGQIAPTTQTDFDARPADMLRLMEVAQNHQLPIHPFTIRALIQNERRATSLRDDADTMLVFARLLTARGLPSGVEKKAPGQDGPCRKTAADWLHLLNQTGLMSAILPEWSRVVGQMQFDTYHIYTVDEHSIAAVRMLGEIENGRMADEIPIVYTLVEAIQSRPVLYFATLIHDIAKGRGGDHSVIGAEIAARLGPSLGLKAEETETLSWLVLHHLLLSQTAFRRDIDDPRTILDLADVIQSPERLRLLLILTVADIRAVSTTVWNAWKATLLRELYIRVAEVLEGGLAASETDERINFAKALAEKMLQENRVKRGETARFLARGYGSYWLGFDSATHVRHARLLAEADAANAPLSVESTPVPSRDVTEVTVISKDRIGLFSRIAGGLAVAGASIVDARIHTLRDGFALDTFWIQDARGKAFDTPAQLMELNSKIERSINDQLDVPGLLCRAVAERSRKRMRLINVPIRVVIDNRASDRHTVIEINGRDRPGLLYRIAQTLNGLGLQISSAHITTYGVRAVDVFYVRDADSNKITALDQLSRIRGAIIESLTEADSVFIELES